METTLRQPKPENLQMQDPAAEAHHRIANSLTLLVSMVRMKAASIARRPDPPSANEVRGLLDGIGARINYRDGKPHYLGDVPRFIRYVRETAGRYAELQPLVGLCDVRGRTAGPWPSSWPPAAASACAR